MRVRNKSRVASPGVEGCPKWESGMDRIISMLSLLAARWPGHSKQDCLPCYGKATHRPIENGRPAPWLAPCSVDCPSSISTFSIPWTGNPARLRCPQLRTWVGWGERVGRAWSHFRKSAADHFDRFLRNLNFLSNFNFPYINPAFKPPYFLNQNISPWQNLVGCRESPLHTT